MTVAALFVSPSGSYAGLEGVDPWDQERDARLYAGPFPVVAHPPCQRWGKFWAGNPTVIARTGVRKTRGDDGGCFEAALNAVRTWGGVLEHPAYSSAWREFGLLIPPSSGGWIMANWVGGWTCFIEQGRYGHWANKPTWLYAVGCDLPSLDWGVAPARLNPETVARIGIERAKKRGNVADRGGGTDSRERIGTPPQFRDLLLSIARTAELRRSLAG